MAAPPGSDPQLIALANQAERANRPAALIAIVGGLVVVAMIALLVGIAGYADGRAMLVREEAAARLVQTRLDEIAAIKAAQPDAYELYKSGRFMGKQLDDVAEEVWETDDLSRIVPHDFPPDRTELGIGYPGIGRLKSEWRPQNQPLETIIEFIEAVLADDATRQERYPRLAEERCCPDLNLVFLGKLQLTPTAAGWSAVIEFRRYYGIKESEEQ